MRSEFSREPRKLLDYARFTYFECRRFQDSFGSTSSFQYSIRARISENIFTTEKPVKSIIVAGRDETEVPAWLAWSSKNENGAVSRSQSC